MAWCFLCPKQLALGFCDPGKVQLFRISVTKKKNSSLNFWLWKIAAPEFVWPRKMCSSPEFYHSPELRALWERNPRKQSKQTPFQLWKFCNMKTVTNWTENKILSISKKIKISIYIPYFKKNSLIEGTFMYTIYVYYTYLCSQFLKISGFSLSL